MKQNISGTAYRVLLVLKYLSEGPQTLEQILEKLNSAPFVDSVITREILKKYLNTIVEGGFQLRKTTENGDAFFELEKALFMFDVEEDTLKILTTLYYVVHNLSIPALIQGYTKFMMNIFKFLPAQQVSFIETALGHNDLADELNFRQYTEQIRMLDGYCADKMALELELYTQEGMKILICSPVKVVFYDNNLYLSIIDHATNIAEFVALKRIHHAKQLPNIAKYSRLSNTVFFRVYGKVAKGYRPYLGEKVLEKEGDSLLISVNINDQELFFRKILRYGKYCKIVSPESTKRAFITYVEKAVNLYTKPA